MGQLLHFGSNVDGVDGSFLDDIVNNHLRATLQETKQFQERMLGEIHPFHKLVGELQMLRMSPHDETTSEGMTQMLQEFMIDVGVFVEGEDGKLAFAELSKFQNRWFAGDRLSVEHLGKIPERLMRKRCDKSSRSCSRTPFH
jgi:hypothetical protein